MAKGTIVAEMRHVIRGDVDGIKWEGYEPAGDLTCKDCGQTWNPSKDGHRFLHCPHDKEK